VLRDIKEAVGQTKVPPVPAACRRSLGDKVRGDGVVLDKLQKALERLKRNARPCHKAPGGIEVARGNGSGVGDEELTRMVNKPEIRIERASV